MIFEKILSPYFDKIKCKLRYTYDSAGFAMIEMITKPSDIAHNLVHEKAHVLMDGGIGLPERKGVGQE